VEIVKFLRQFKTNVLVGSSVPAAHLKVIRSSLAKFMFMLFKHTCIIHVISS